MIVSHNYPYLDISYWIGDQKLQGSAYVDTGFDGCLVVPEAVARELMVPFHLTVVDWVIAPLGWLTSTWEW